MSLKDAIKDTLSGLEDRAGINKFDVYVAETKEASDHPSDQMISEIQAAIQAELGDEERKWYFIQMAMSRYGISNTFLAEFIRAALAEPHKIENPRARYHAIRAMARASGTLLPSEVKDEDEIRSTVPSLWLELFLEAYRNGHPDTITEQIVKMVSGSSPQLSWKAIRSKLPEIRIAFDDTSEFRRQIKIISNAIHDVQGRQSLLDAAEKRVGGGLDRTYTIIGRKAKSRPFSIPEKLLKVDSSFSTKRVSPTGEIAIGVAA